MVLSIPKENLNQVRFLVCTNVVYMIKLLYMHYTAYHKQL